MYKKNNHIHFVGIGGIGMSGIASILKKQGYTISGCDPDITQDTVTMLQSLGCPIYHGNNSPSCADSTIDILVYIPMYEHSIPAITTEITRAREHSIITVTRAQMLAELMRSSYGIAVSGSHGKTTTSAMISHILLHSDYDPTIVIGGVLHTINANSRQGNGSFFVAEADESDRSFLQLNPTIAVITNIDVEHLETYRDLDDIKQTFITFANNLPFYGKVIMCADDEHSQAIVSQLTHPILSYGINNPAQVRAQNIELEAVQSHFEVFSATEAAPLGSIMLPIAGLHNVYNALAAITLSLEIGIPFEQIKAALACFAGVDRRFTFHGHYKKAEIFDDYGHHPKEIAAIVAVAQKKTKNNLIVVFQPHRYTRTEKLWNDFISVLTTNTINTLIITDIYSAGERAIDGISSEQLGQTMIQAHPHKNIIYRPFTDNFDHIFQAVDQNCHPNDLILFLGAGKTNAMAKSLSKYCNLNN